MSLSRAFSMREQAHPKAGDALGGFQSSGCMGSWPVLCSLGASVHLRGLFAVTGWHFDNSQVRSPRAVVQLLAGSLSPAEQPRAPACGGWSWLPSVCPVGPTAQARARGHLRPAVLRMRQPRPAAELRAPRREGITARPFGLWRGGDALSL